MGSSKKHKEKDKDRERKRDKERKHREKDDKDRDRDSDKERRRKEDRSRDKRSHGALDVGERVEKKKVKREDYDDLFEYAVGESAQDDKRGIQDNGAVSQQQGDVSLSIQETNKLRIKLGLKPLEVPEPSVEKEGEKSVSLKEDVHIPAVNMSDQKETENFKRKLEEMREKRRINKKLGKVKTLGTKGSDEEDSAASWVAKSRKKEEDKILAEKRAQLLAEMDEEFGISNLVEEEFGSFSRKRQPTYFSQDLSGLKVEHSQEHFMEGNSTILTLKDGSVLDEEEDALINVNIVDKEKGEKNIELSKRKPDYRPYDEPETDEFGMIKPRGLLQKYDEEIEGEKKKSFVLGSGGTYDTTKEDEVKKIQAKLKAQMVSLEIAKPQLAVEYYTQEEMVKFKKPKKKRKIKKRETLKADDLEELPGQTDLSSDRGSRSVKSILKNAPRRHEREKADDDDDMMELDPLVPDEEEQVVDDGDHSVIVEEDEAQLELQLALERSRRLKKKKEATGVERVLETLATVVKQESDDENGKKDSIILNSTSEFCRTLGEIPTFSAPEEQMEEIEDDNEWRMDVERDDEVEPHGGWEWVKTQEEKRKKEREEETESSILEAEPLVGKGVAAALFLAGKKGLLEQTSKTKIEGKVLPVLPSVGVVDEEKMREEERERGVRSSRDFDRERDRDRDRDRYGGSSKNKQEYKPDVKLEYYDDNGRSLTPKEAFRYLSHKFHGKASGKMKSEKRNKKRQDEVALQKMNSGDTPLNSTALLIEKQKNAQSPYVILSGGGQTFSTGTTISKKK